jgi:cytochrome c oxidase cbb3-type subunit IV
MDIITDLRIIATVAAFVTFVGIWVWAWSGRHKEDFDEAARLPLEGDEE